MNTLVHVSLLLATATLSSTNVVKPNTDGTFELLILHNNDMHARFEQTSQLSGTCTTADRDAGKCYGGFARVAHVVKEARRAAASGEGPPVLYLNAGDTYTGTAWFTIYKWQIAAEFINALQPDAVSIGNNELTAGSAQLSPFLKEINTAILATNIQIKSDDSHKLHKSIIMDVKGVKVGLLGYLKLQTDVLDSTDNIEYIDELIALQEEVENLKQQNVSIIIALGHADDDRNMEIAREVDGVDIVIAGHKNVYFWNGTRAEDQHDSQDTIVTQESGRQVLVVHSYAYNRNLGKIQAQFDYEGELITYETEPIQLDTKIVQDSETIHFIDTYRNELFVRSEEIVGETAVVLDGDSCKSEECNLGNLITDSITYYYALRFEGERWTDAPIAVIPGGLIAGSIAPTNRPASVTKGDLLAALPTESHLVTVTVNGTILLQILEHSVSQYSVSKPTGQFLQFSGIRTVYDLSRESGSRLVNAVVRCWACYVPEYYVIDTWRDYKMLMPVSLVNGEYGYTMLAGLPREDIVYDEITCTAEYIGLRSPVYPDVAGRIELVNVGDGEPDGLGGEDNENEEEEEEDNENEEEDNESVEEEEDNENIEEEEESGGEEDAVTDSALDLSSSLLIVIITLLPMFA